MNLTRKIISVFIFLTVFSILSAQYSTVRVGVMPFSSVKGNESNHDIVSGITGSMSKYKFISLVEQAEIKKITDEIVKGQIGLVDENTAVQAGKIYGIQVMIVGTVDGSTVNGRAVLVETCKIIATASSEILSADKLGNKLAAGIESYLSRENLKKLRNDSPQINFDFWAIKDNGKKINANTSGSLKIGTNITFKFRSDISGYCTIVDIQPGGDVVVLFPNESQPDNRIIAGKEYSVPSKDDSFRITISEPAGTDTVVAYFTKNKVDWLNRKSLEGDGFWSVKEGEKYIQSKGIAVTAIKLKASEWESREIEIEVLK